MIKQITTQLKKKSVLLSILLAVFFVKGLVFAALLPALQGFDEPNHFVTAQYFSLTKYGVTGTEPISYVNELKSDSAAIGYDQTRNPSFNTQNFSDGLMGQGEDRIQKDTARKDLDVFPKKYILSPYARSTSFINYLLKDESFLFRLFTLRIFSVILGTLIVWLVFLTARSSGFSENPSLLFAGIFAFQPMLTNVTSIINYDVMLTLAFVLFAYSSINLIKNGFSRKFALLAALAAFIGIFTKGSGIVLAGLLLPLAIYVAQKKLRLSKTKLLILLPVFLVAAATLSYFFSPYSLNQITRMDNDSHFKTLGKSLRGYQNSTIKSFEKYSRTYWGDFGWIGAPISDNVLRFIWAVETICLIGLIVFLVSKKNPSFLPSKTVALFLMVIFLALQFGVRFADWAAFNDRGHIIYGTSGRYFIPVLFAHLLLLAIGAGTLSRRENIFNIVLKTGFVLMALFYCYSMISVIIPRYYL